MADVAEAFVTMRPDFNQFGSGLERGMPFGKFAKLGAAAGAAMVAAAGVALFKIGDEFQKATATIRIGTGATGEALAGLQESFRNVAAEVPASFGDASAAVADLNTRLGLTGEPLEKMSEQFLDLARITGGDVANQVALGTRVFGDWAVATEDQSGALDKMFRAAQASGAGVEDLMTQVVQFGSPLRGMGFSLDEATALFAKFEKEGVNAELVIGSLRQGLGRMAREGEDAPETFRRIIDEITNMESRTEATAAAMELFGARAGPDMAAAIQEGRFELGSMLEAIEGGSDTIDQAASDTDSWRESWQLIKNNVFLALEPIATRVFGAIADWAERAVSFVQEVRVLFSNPDVQAEGWLGTVQSVVAGFVTFKETVSGIIETVTGLFQSNSDSIQSSTAGTWTRITEIFASAADAITAIVSTFVSIVQGFWDRFGVHILGYIERTWSRIQTVFNAALNIIQGVFETFAGLFTGDWSRMWDGIKQILGGIWEAIKAIVGQAFDALKTLLGAGLAALSQLWSEVWERIRGKLSEIWEGIKSGVSEGIDSVIGWFRDLPGRIITALGNLGNLLKDAGRAVLQGLWDGLRDKWESVKDWVGGLGSKIKGLKGPLPEDKRLLKDEGRAIIEGLGSGMQDEWSAIERFLNTRTAEIPLNVARPNLDFASRQTMRPIELTLDLGEGVSRRIRIEQDRHDGQMLVGLKKGQR